MLKKIIPIFLLVVICINHLNIIDAVGHFSAKYKAGLLMKGKDMQAEKETEKESKEKSGEEEKFLHKSQFFAASSLIARAGKQPAAYLSLLYENPCHEKDIQPPKIG